MELPDLSDKSLSPTRRFVGQALRIPPATIVGEMKISPNHDPIAGYTDSALAVITNKVIPEESGVENTLGAAIEDMLYIGQGVRYRFGGVYQLIHTSTYSHGSCTTCTGARSRLPELHFCATPYR